TAPWRRLDRRQVRARRPRPDDEFGHGLFEAHGVRFGRALEPGFLAAPAPNLSSGRPQGGRIDHKFGRAIGAGDDHAGRTPKNSIVSKSLSLYRWQHKGTARALKP